MKLSPISLAVLPLLTVFTANAAVYQIVELDTTKTVRSTSGVAATLQGDVIVNGSTILDFEIDLDAMDFENPTIVSLLTAEQLADAKNGIIDTTVKSILLNYLGANPNLLNQPVGLVRVIRQAQNGAVEQVVIRDTAGTKGNNEFAYDVNRLGQVAAVASPIFTKETFTATIVPVEGAEEPEVPVIPQPVTVWVPEPGYLLGYVADGTKRHVLPPAFTELGGGMSAAQGLNDNGQVVGFTSTGVTESLQTSITTGCNGNSQPIPFCLNVQLSSRGINLNSLITRLINSGTADGFDQGYFERAALWQFDQNGAALQQTWGFLGEKGSGDVAPTSDNYNVPTYYSRANAINNNGTAVGHSIYSDSTRTIRFFNPTGGEFSRIYTAPHATIYKPEPSLTPGGHNPSVQGFINSDEWLASVATHINDDNLITGFALKNINSAIRNRMFVYNMNDSTLRFPEGFFSSSSTEPQDMNNDGKVVGRAEVIVGGTTTRRFHAFIYDSKTDVFQDLNNLLACDAPTLVEATSINDNGEILATALIRRPLLGPSGEEQKNDAGEVIQQEQATAVKLRPIPNGTPENCNSEETQYERKSGSFSAFWLMLLGVLPLLRRRKV